MKTRNFLIGCALVLLIGGCRENTSLTNIEPAPEKAPEKAKAPSTDISVNAAPEESPHPEPTPVETPPMTPDPKPSETAPEEPAPEPTPETPPTPEMPRVSERCIPNITLPRGIATTTFLWSPSLGDRLIPSSASARDLDRSGRIDITEVTDVRRFIPCSSPAPEPVPEPVHETPPPALQSCSIDANDHITFTQGQNGGFGKSPDPAHEFNIIFGPPKGAGAYRGSLDVLSLGRGGEIVVELTDCILFDSAGPDFTVFENAFNNFTEPGFVSVSEDGVHYSEFSCDPNVRPYEGCAGITPVYANPANSIDPFDPTVSGGDTFDLHDVGLTTARFIKIRDANVGSAPVGPETGGFDLDAIAIINGTLP